MDAGYNTKQPIFEEINERFKDVYLGLSQKIFGKEDTSIPRATEFNDIGSFVTDSTYDALLGDSKLDRAFYQIWKKDSENPGMAERYQNIVENKGTFKEMFRYAFNVDNSRKRDIASKFYISDKKTLENKTE